MDPKIKAKDFVTSTLRSRLGDSRAKAVISAVSVLCGQSLFCIYQGN